MKKDLISIKDLTLKEIDEIFDLTDRLKKDKTKFSKALAGKTLALIFQKPSNRTRVSFEVGMYQLGGYSVYLGPDEINLGVRESIHDVAKTLSRYVNGIVLRTFEHKNTVEMAKFATIAVINGLSDFSHPCQAMADIYSVKEKLKNIKGKTLAYIGDGNNVCNSLIFACDKVGMNINVATPGGYEPSQEILKTKSRLNLFNDPFSAVKDVDVIYTDVWASMGQEAQAQERKRAFQGFQINTKLVSLAKKNVLIMHCLPAHRGQEITDEVIDSPNSIVFDQAENRMHVQKAILIKLLGGKCPAS
ncbi:MAG: ornithine carbamoyltransferase [Candidatus Omnitrophota bacterium]